MRLTWIALLMMLPALALAQGELRDPTRPPTQAEIEAWFGNGPASGQRSPFRLQSILLAPDRRIAVIDGQRLRLGESVDNAEVKAIEPGRVVLERNGERIELTIESHLTNNNDGSRY
ncbi:MULTISPECIES: general secretion pathway protein GspB [unclassified Wenzhouxiangella]|uniref:general secretion pathway protein GspB n=1 Tax=unclassified Wenzhouxiangella TaxID=2613841 RepID=UPI0015F27E58|nr:MULTISPECIES: general secretion pathway protein GspB [unclassified Wenzhouxiangella]